MSDPPNAINPDATTHLHPSEQLAYSLAALLSSSPAAAETAAVDLHAEAADLNRLTDAQVLRIASIAAASATIRDSRAFPPQLAPASEFFLSADPRDRAAWAITHILERHPSVAAHVLDRSEDDASAAADAIDERIQSFVPGARDIARDALQHDPTPEAIARIRDRIAPIRKRRRRIAALQLLALITFCLLMIFVLVDLLGWDEQQDRLREQSERFSNPMRPSTPNPTTNPTTNPDNLVEPTTSPTSPPTPQPTPPPTPLQPNP